MRIVVLCHDPEAAERDPDAVASVLSDLGCRVLLGRLDCGGLNEEQVVARPVTVVVIDAGDELERGNRCLRHLSTYEPLAGSPVLMALSVARLPALDFSLGASDFILKPLVPAELYARVRQLDWKSAGFGSDQVIKLGDLVIDSAGYEVRLGARNIVLTHQEFELLAFLAKNRGRVFTRDQLLQRVWGYEYFGGSRTVDIHVRRLRAKLGETAGAMIQTVRNVGYKVAHGD